jgi:hypothetical protein
MTRSRLNAWLTAYVAGLQIVSPGFITVALGRWNCCIQHCGTGPLARLAIRKNATAVYLRVNAIGVRLVEGLIALIKTSSAADHDRPRHVRQGV